MRRSRLKITVGCVLGVSVCALMAMLIEGCHREQPVESGSLPPPDLSSNLYAMDYSNSPAMSWPSNSTSVVTAPSNPVVNPAPVAPVVIPPVAPPVDVSSTSTYEVKAGDTLAKIAKAHGVTLKALEAVNPGVDSRKLKLKQKINIPAATASTDTATAVAMGGTGVTDAGGETYVVKSGDNLSKIATKHGVTLKALKSANNLTTDHIKVGDKLKIPAKASAVTSAPAPAPDTTAAPMLPPPSSTPAPGR